WTGKGQRATGNVSLARFHRRAGARLPLRQCSVHWRLAAARRGRTQSDRGGGGGRAGLLRAIHVELSRDRGDLSARRRGGRGALGAGGDRVRRAQQRSGGRASAAGRGPESRRRSAHRGAHHRAAGVTVLLKPLELLWRGVNRARRALYRAGVLKAKRLPRPVISVGSI